MKRIISANLSSIQDITNSNTPLVGLGVAKKQAYVDGKRTDQIDSVVLTAVSEVLGEISLVFPPRKGIADKLEERVPFTAHFFLSDLEDIARVADVKVTTYNGSLLIKILLEV